MVAIIRAVALGLLVVAVTLHVVGFVTNVWIESKLDTRGIEGIMSANDMGPQQPNQVGLKIQMGLWKYCMHSTMSGAPGGQAVDMCQSIDSKIVPGWMKGVKALGILSIIAAVLAMALVIYSFIGDSKGDRARLLPYIMAAVTLAAGVLLLVAVTVYGIEYHDMMMQQTNTLGSLGENAKENTSLGYSFALETVSGVLMVVVSVLLVIPARFSGGGRQNMAV